MYVKMVNILMNNSSAQLYFAVFLLVKQLMIAKENHKLHNQFTNKNIQFSRRHMPNHHFCSPNKMTFRILFGEQSQFVCHWKYYIGWKNKKIIFGCIIFINLVRIILLVSQKTVRWIWTSFYLFFKWICLWKSHRFHDTLFPPL